MMTAVFTVSPFAVQRVFGRIAVEKKAAIGACAAKARFAPRSGFSEPAGHGAGPEGGRGGDLVSPH